jgi:hypothetical protein
MQDFGSKRRQTTRGADTKSDPGCTRYARWTHTRPSSKQHCFLLHTLPFSAFADAFVDVRPTFVDALSMLIFNQSQGEMMKLD